MARTSTVSALQVSQVRAVVHRVARWLRDEEARPVQRILDHTWTKLAYDPYLPCTGQGFLAASGAVSLVIPGGEGQAEGQARNAGRT
jgi:hypothetical protein